MFIVEYLSCRLFSLAVAEAWCVFHHPFISTVHSIGTFQIIKTMWCRGWASRMQCSVLFWESLVSVPVAALSLDYYYYFFLVYFVFMFIDQFQSYSFISIFAIFKLGQVC